MTDIVVRGVWTRRYGTPVWDAVIRGTGIAGLLAIPLVLYVSYAAGLVAFAVITVWVNGPISIFLPASYEPLLMLFGQLYPPLVIAAVGTAGALYVEFFNYYLYRGVLGLEALRGVREGRVTRWMTRFFRRWPFAVVWVAAWSPIPFWLARALAALTGYSLRRHLLATGLGRFPRYWAFAALGAALDIPERLLWIVAVGTIVLGVCAALWKAWSGRGGAQPASGVAPHGSAG